MKTIIHFANKLDAVGLTAIADQLDKILRAYEEPDKAALDKADKQAIDLMKKAIEEGKVPDHLAEQMYVWIRNKESELH